MKNLLCALLIMAGFTTFAQDNANAFFDKAPKIKKTTLNLLNDKPTFNTSKWFVVNDKSIYTDLFAVENDKIWTGQQVTQIRMLGWWGISDGQVAYIYAYDLLDSEGTKSTSVFLSTYKGIGGKTTDVDPFAQNPSPTGMRGKITKTTTLNINDFGAMKLTTTHKSSNGKVLKKEQTFHVAESGYMERAQ